MFRGGGSFSNGERLNGVFGAQSTPLRNTSLVDQITATGILSSAANGSQTREANDDDSVFTVADDFATPQANARGGSNANNGPPNHDQ